MNIKTPVGLQPIGAKMATELARPGLLFGTNYLHVRTSGGCCATPGGDETNRDLDQPLKTMPVHSAPISHIVLRSYCIVLAYQMQF